MIPVLIIGFNRPDKTKKVFEIVCANAPPCLYFSLDGPRKGNARDDLAHRELLRIFQYYKDKYENINFYLNIHDKNMGCRIAVPSAINWFFKDEEYGVILEDDILPNSSFFRFMEEMLILYSNDENVYQVNGYVLTENGDSSKYWKSKVFHCWGWGTWKGAWSNYSDSMSLLESNRTNVLDSISKDKRIRIFFSALLDSTRQGKNSSWFFRWILAAHMSNGYCICPQVSLVENIGIDSTATHSSKEFHLANHASDDMIWPIHECDNGLDLDHYFFTNFYRLNNNIRFARVLIQRYIPNYMFWFIRNILR